MKKAQTQAWNEYIGAKEALLKFCEKFTELTPYVLDDQYPIRVQFIPNSQFSIFGNENVDENGEINDLIVSVGLTTAVKSTLKFKMDSKLLKKLIKLAETVGTLYYHAFREEHGGRLTPKRPFIKAMDGFDADVASELVCPNCENPIVNQWAKGTKPAFCQGCGQELDWTQEPPTDFDKGIERLRELCNKKETKQ